MSTNHFNELNESEAERLALLIEECAEVQKAATKILRHGYRSINPDDAYAVSNRQALAEEVGHLMFATEFCIEHRDIANADVQRALERKSRTVRQWLHHDEGFDR